MSFKFTDITNLKYLDDKILDSIRRINEGRMSLNEETLNNLSAKIEKFISGTEMFNRYCISENMRADLGDVCSKYKRHSKLFESAFVSFATRLKTINEGFFNPFDVDDMPEELPNVEIAKQKRQGKKSTAIYNIRLWNSNKPTKCYYDGECVKSGTEFCDGDVIEQSPVKFIGSDELYSKNIRDLAFEVDRSKNMFCIPFGNAVFYRTSFDTRREPNATYTFDVDSPNPTITIIATTRIHCGDEIILNATEEDFQNEMHPTDFQYRCGTDPVYSVKSFKIV
jgi:hypothetical protein